ncbi:hypothetical protein PG985_010485 [Apiospora marii]|uniref:Wax synthase domain-containing protein n=1 Tax=Apiospora marii TaxID=335849 RepID=A0ABR1RZK5_9PEZI
MELHPTLFSMLSLIAATTSFSLAIQRSSQDRIRLAFGTLHTASVIAWLLVISFQSSPSLYSQLAVPFITGLTIHSTAIVFLQKSMVRLDDTSISQRMRTIYRVWSNVRNLPLDRSEVELPERPGNQRLWFAAKRGARLCALWAIECGASSTMNFLLIRRGVTLGDFSPAHQGLVPSASDMEVRGIMSVYWIWTAYHSLTVGHDLAAILFVAILGWDEADEWPPLFGNLMEAYTLRRFWGVFWHRLHVHSFMLFIPLPRYLRSKLARGAFVSFSIFVLGALSHAAANLVNYRQHFLIRSEEYGFLDEQLG